MFKKQTEAASVPALPGIERKTLAYGAATMLVEFRLKQGSQLPRHAHPHEQTGYLVSGHLRLSIAGEVNDVRPGDSWSIAGGVEHGAEILADSVAVEVFAPVRADYLP